MKYTYKDSDDLILRKALFLRYGGDNVNISDPPLLSWRFVSQMMKVSYDKII